MKTEYPAVGLSQICKLRPGTDYEQLCQQLAERIVELAKEEPLPELNVQGGLSQIGNKWMQSEKGSNGDTTPNGPLDANVVYVVGTRTEMKSTGIQCTDMYAEKREGWCPFQQAMDTTVETLTKKAINQAGLKMCNLEFSDNLLEIIEIAEQRNSPVLLVFDRHAIFLKQIEERMREYDRKIFDYCGLVTAGGHEVSDDQIKQVFKHKSKKDYQHHVWNVPTAIERYVSSVASVLGGIKQEIMIQGQPVRPLPGGSLPEIHGPSGG
jgi:hypothetical protein